MKIKCTYENCFKHFATYEAMLAHKKKDPKHHYCAQCDVDCDDDLAYFIHQLGSSNHICCPVCAKEFGSASGRDRHFESDHQRAQRMECAGCSIKFSSASALMNHIENDECDVIRLTDFQMQRAEKQIQKDAWAAETDPFGINPFNRDRDTTINTDTSTDLLGSQHELDASRSLKNSLGGPISVASHRQFPSLPNASLAEGAEVRALGNISSSAMSTSNLIDLEQSNVAAMSRMKISRNRNTTTSRNCKQPAQQEEDASGRVKGWLNSVNNTVTPPSDNHSEVASMYDRKVPKSTVSAKVQSSTRAQPNPDAPRRHIIQMPAHSIVSSDKLDTERFWDAIRQEYICPGEKCRRHFKTVTDFRQHLLSSAHVGGTVVCPLCLKRFATTAAWVSHTESASKKCNIRNSVHFNQVLREISGGVLGANGHMDDGTVNYVAPKIEEW